LCTRIRLTSGRYGGVGLVAEAAQGVVGTAGELAGHRQGGPAGVDPRRDVGVIEVAGGAGARSLLPGPGQRPAQDRRPLVGQVPGVRLPSEAYTVTSGPQCRTACAEEENRRASPRNAQITTATSRPTPNSSRASALHAGWRRANPAICARSGASPVW
jgi:hypothetical protein